MWWRGSLSVGIVVDECLPLLADQFEMERETRQNSKSLMDSNSWSKDGRSNGRIDIIDCVTNILRRIAVEDCAYLVLDGSMEVLANGIHLQVLDRDWYCLDSIAD
jgi:hypothetical protein